MCIATIADLYIFCKSCFIYNSCDMLIYKKEKSDTFGVAFLIYLNMYGCRYLMHANEDKYLQVLLLHLLQQCYFDGIKYQYNLLLPIFL